MTQPGYIQKTFEVFSRSYINSNNEIIISEKGNVYFRLEDVENKNDYIKKILHWCSRSACKAMPYSSPRYNRLFRQTIREKLNKIIGKDFTEDEWATIYQYLGNGINSKLSTRFIESGFDLSVLASTRAR